MNINSDISDNCEKCQSHLQDYLDGDLAKQLCAEIDVHLKQCPECGEALEEEKRIRDLLRGIPVPPPSDGFVERAFRVAQQTAAQQQGHTSSHHRRHGFFWGFGSAMAAGLALWAVLGIFQSTELPQNPGSGSEIAGAEVKSPEITIALHETHNLRLAFHAKSDVKNAMISIQLPENVMLDGYPGERNLAWQTDLAKGDNTLTLPIRAKQLDDGVLLAKIVHNGQTKTIRVNLQVSKPSSSGLFLLPKVNA